MKWIIAIFGLLLFFTFANAEIYKWVDEKGTLHFTEDPSTIPEKYRDKIKSRQTEEDKMTPEERVKAKEEYERERKKRLEKERLEYEQSVKEEEKRRNIRRAEDAAEERRIRTEKEEKTRKSEEIKTEDKSKEQAPQQMKLVKCMNCRKGYIKCSLCDGKGGKFGFVTRTEKTFHACPKCSGTGEVECPVCKGLGFIQVRQ